MNSLFKRIFPIILSTDWDLQVEPCDQCTRRICCQVFAIVDVTHQGRKETVIKPAWEVCKNLGADCNCAIYAERDILPGYQDACASFKCHGAGPLVDKFFERIDMELNDPAAVPLLLKYIQIAIDSWLKGLRAKLLADEALLMK